MIKSHRLPPLPKPAPLGSCPLKIKKALVEHPLTPTQLNRIRSQQDDSRHQISKRPSSKHSRPGSSVSIKSARSRGSSSGSLKGQKAYFERLYGSENVYLEMPKVSAKSWVLYEIKHNKCLFGHRQFKRRQIASLTKMLNLVTILSLVDKVQLQPSEIKARASYRASHVNGTTAELRQNRIYSLEDLYYGMMLPSGNDAATMIAQIGAVLLKMIDNPSEMKNLQDQDDWTQAIIKEGTAAVGNYMREMNRKAKELGMLNTNLANPHGLSNTASYSTASDLAKLCSFGMKNHIFRKIVNTQKYQYTYQDPVNPIPNEVDKENLNPNMSESETVPEKFKHGAWENTNRMLGLGWSGIKTGITPNAGPCLAASYLKTVQGKQFEFLVILLNSKSMQARWQEVQSLVQWAIKYRIYQ